MNWKVIEFENAVCNYTGAKYGIAVTNGTCALHIVCLTIGVKEGDEAQGGKVVEHKSEDHVGLLVAVLWRCLD